MAVIALATQVAFYASARQRLPLALALLVAVPVAAAFLAGRAPWRAGGARRGVAAAVAGGGGCDGWRPPGVAPLTACFAFGREVALRSGPAAGALVAAPALRAFPVLEAQLLR